jgi:hypothetical protein
MVDKSDDRVCRTQGGSRGGVRNAGASGGVHPMRCNITRLLRIAAVVMLAAVGCLAIGSPAHAGGWATTLPERLEPGRAYTVGYWVLQHGSRPHEGDLRRTALHLARQLMGAPDQAVGTSPPVPPARLCSLDNSRTGVSKGSCVLIDLRAGAQEANAACSTVARKNSNSRSVPAHQAARSRAGMV